MPTCEFSPKARANPAVDQNDQLIICDPEVQEAMLNQKKALYQDWGFPDTNQEIRFNHCGSGGCREDRKTDCYPFLNLLWKGNHSFFSRAYANKKLKAVQKALSKNAKPSPTA